MPMAGCTPPPASPEAPASEESPTASSAASPGVTGALDEESFKKLHELDTAEAPPLKGTDIDLEGSTAYLSLPPGKTAPVPGVVVIHEWWGLNDHIRHYADRVAAEGYAALAVDIYAGKVATTPDEALAALKAVQPEHAVHVLHTAHTFLREDPRVAAPRRGTIGWCAGGGWSLQAAIHESDLDAAVIYYGPPVTDEAELAKINAKLLGIYGNQDQGIPPAAVDDFVAALGRAGKSIEVHRYDAVHAFANPSNPKYDPQAAGDAWIHVRDFFQRTLAQPE